MSKIELMESSDKGGGASEAYIRILLPVYKSKKKKTLSVVKYLTESESAWL